MSDEKKPEKPVAKKISLTDLTTDVGTLTTLLQRHTAARNFLYQAATGDIDAPNLRLSAHIDGDKNFVEVNTADLDGATVEILLGAMVEHEERRAIMCWQALNANTTAALSLITQIEKQREQAAKKTEETKPEEPAILPFQPKPQ